MEPCEILSIIAVFVFVGVVIFSLETMHEEANNPSNKENK